MCHDSAGRIKHFGWVWIMGWWKMTSLCAMALKLIETHKKAYVVCAMTLLVELSILDESGSNIMKNE